MLLKFTLLNGTEWRCHEKCAKEGGLILSSTQAKSFLGPTLFGKMDGQPELPCAYGSNGSYGQARFYRVDDMNALLVKHGKAEKSYPKKAPKAPRGRFFLCR